MYYSTIIESLWFILPAYIANSIANDVAHLPILKKYSYPIDSYKTWHGRRILGDGKTWRGLICGVIAGTFTGYVQQIIYYDANFFLGTFIHSNNLNLFPMTIKLAFIISLGALIGDMVASFGKRLIGLPSGYPAPLLDQLDYIFGAFFFAWTLVPVDLDKFAIVVIITIPLHLVSNLVAYALKLKKVPW